MKLAAHEIDAQLAGLPHWKFNAEQGGMLTREFVFEDFAQAFGFMAQVAVHAEKRNHHPEWFNVYNRVAVTLTTHDVGGISSKDMDMALLMDRIAAALSTQKH